MRIAAPVAALAVLLSLAACSAGGDWPSLARRPGESAPLPEAAPTTAPVETPVTTAASGPAPAVTSGRLAEATRDFAGIEKRWQTQSAATETAVAAARGTSAGNPAATKAELELSRLDRVGAQIADLRTRLDGIGGDLALSAASGADVASMLRELGALIARVETLRAEQNRVAETARAAIPR